MKNYKETLMRLIIIHEHFSSGRLYENHGWSLGRFNNDEVITVLNKINSYCDTYPFVFIELTYLFSEWQNAGNGIIIYQTKPKLEYREGLQHFLQISAEDYDQIFVPNREFDKLYGYRFSVNDRAKQIGENIRIFFENETKNEVNIKV